MQDHILFKTLSFQRKDYVSSRVQDNIVFITMWNNTSERVTFKDHDEAVEGLKELHAMLNNTESAKNNSTENTNSTKKVSPDLEFLANLLKTNSSKVVSVLDNVNAKLSSVVDDTKNKAESAILGAALKMFSTKVDKNIHNLFGDLEQIVNDILKPESNDAPDAPEKKDSTENKDSPRTSMFESVIKGDIFGSSKAKTTDKLIGDMYSNELKNAVDTAIDELLKTERAQSMMDDVLKNFGTVERDKAVAKIKEIVFNRCLTYPEKTIKEVLNMYF